MFKSTDRLEYDGEDLIARTPMDAHDLARLRPESTYIYIPDGRKISPKQSRKAWALIGEIAAWEGYDLKKHRYEIQKRFYFFFEEYPIQDIFFSLSPFKKEGVDMTTARHFISYMIDFCLKNDIPCTDISLLKACEDIGRYLYGCLIWQKCSICGLPYPRCTLHHIDAIGAGNDRNEVEHIGREASALCKQHHAEAHQMGWLQFKRKYHILGIVIDRPIAEVWWPERYKPDLSFIQKGGD